MSELLDKRYLKHLSDRPGTPGLCVVCIDRINKEAFTDTCAHSFCFACISRWAEVNAVCPLCKSKFKNIIHNVKSETLYDIHKINKPTPTQDHQIFTLIQFLPPINGATRRSANVSALPSSWNSTDGTSTSLPTSTTRRFYSRIPRTQIYSLNLLPLESPSYNGRLRQATPEFYRNNEAQIHRLIPWIIRDLEAIKAISGFGFDINVVSDVIITALPSQRIQGQHMRSLVHPFLTRYTSHFLRELYLFAISPLDLIGYDREVEYRSGSRDIPPRRIMMRLDINVDNADHDILEFSYRDEFPDIIEVPSVTLSPPVQTVPEPVSIEDSEDDCVVISTVTRNQNHSRDVVVISDSESDDVIFQPASIAGPSNISIASERRSSRREAQAGTSGRSTVTSASTSQPDRIIPSTERSRVDRKRPTASKLRSTNMNGPSTSRAAAHENSDESGSDEDDRNWQLGKVRSYVTRKKQKTRRNLANNDTGSSSDESDENEGNWESSKMKSYLKRKKLKAKNDKQNEAMKKLRTKMLNKSKPVTAEIVPESGPSSSSSSQPDRAKIKLRSVVGKVINHRREVVDPETASRYSGLRKRKATSYIYDSDTSD